MTEKSWFENYSKEIQDVIKKLHIEAGQPVEVARGDKRWSGAIMPRIGGDANALVLKLENGYNIGIEFNANVKITKAKQVENVAATEAKATTKKVNLQRPTIAILHTGGTMASRLDYRTGAVEPLVTADDLVAMYPELSEIANIRARIIFQMFSEDMEPEHWAAIAHEVYKEIREEGCDGVIISHGTDTMYYTASALAFMLQDLPVPVILTASQRSSDRPSSDAGFNLIAAARFIAGSDWSGVGVCMHASSSDETCWILPATRCRKMHSSRRDTYRPIDTKPIALIHAALNSIEMIDKNYPRKDAKRVPKLVNTVHADVGLFKVYPGMRAEQLDWYEQNCHGLLIEGYAFGQMPINKLDELTARHPELLAKLEKIAKKIPVYVATQLPYGRINMNVYSTSRDILKAGVRPIYMQSPVAYVKLIWALGQTQDKKKVDEIMQRDVAGETYSRTETNDFPDKAMEKTKP